MNGDLFIKLPNGNILPAFRHARGGYVVGAKGHEKIIKDCKLSNKKDFESQQLKRASRRFL